MNEIWLTENLTELCAALWQTLVRGVADGKSPLHTPVLTTLSHDGPNARVVVLRECSPPARLLRCHTDARSPKVAEIQHHPVTSWLFYDAARKIQIRLNGPTRIHCDDSLALAAWHESRPSSRRCYLVTEAPGTPQDAPYSGLPAHLTARAPSVRESEPGWANFAVIVAEITSLDWLYLEAKGHRRAQFAWNGTGWDGTWVIP